MRLAGCRRKFFRSAGEFEAIDMNMRLIERFKSRWSSPAGYRQLLAMAIPLILSTGALSVQFFVDRMFLTWYSSVAIAAVVPAGILNFAIASVFIGTAGYVNAFVAQYFGAGRYERIGPSVWQGIYVALAGGLVLLMIAPASTAIFRFIGHSPEVQRAEATYFRILCYGSFFPIASAAMTGFFSGRGRNWPVMVINTSATCVNILLNYLLIFGRWGFPEMGVAGAALATVISGVLSFLVYLLALARPAFDKTYKTLRGWAFNSEFFRRLLRFGLPSGVQFFIDMAGFSIFLLIVGRIGTVELAATNITFNINTLAFMPMIGFGIAISVTVGQYIGEFKPEMAERAVYSGAQITFLYMALIAMAYVGFPQVFVFAFSARANPEEFAPIGDLVRILLRFVALYTLFDTLNIVFASAIKGAGDTRFVMIMIVGLSLGALVFPTFLVLIVFEKGIYAAWIIISIYVILLGGSFLLRFLTGKWKSMRVIEQTAQSTPPAGGEVS
jgi:MATE family multidrug resistance protein